MLVALIARKENALMNLFDLLSARRSVRQYTKEPIEHDKLQQIAAAGLMTPSSKNLRSTEFLVVEDRALISQMAHCKPRFGEMLQQASAAIVVLGRCCCLAKGIPPIKQRLRTCSLQNILC